MVNGKVGFGKERMCSYKHTHNGAVHIKTSVKGPYHVVRKGQTLYAIANHFGTSINELKKLNKIKGNKIVSGQKLKVGTSNEQVLNNVLNINIRYSYQGRGKNQIVKLRETPFGDYLQQSWNESYQWMDHIDFLNFIPKGHAPGWFVGYDDVNNWRNLSWEQKAIWFDRGNNGF